MSEIQLQEGKNSQHNEIKSYSGFLFERVRCKETWLTGCIGEAAFPLKVGGSWRCSVTIGFWPVRLGVLGFNTLGGNCGLEKWMFSHLYHLAKIHLRSAEIFCSYTVGEIGLPLYLDCCCCAVL